MEYFHCKRETFFYGYRCWCEAISGCYGSDSSLQACGSCREFYIEEPSAANRYAEYTTRHRLGQGAFRVLVTDAYQQRCAITGEKTLPVLEAAHIRPYGQEGPHSVKNGMLLKSDFHTLFDDGYLTIIPELKVEVSQRLHNDYGNGKDYYKHHGQPLLIVPGQESQLPSREYLEWHNEHIYLG